MPILNPSILLVEDDDQIRELFVRQLGAEGFVVAAVEGAEEALLELRRRRPDILVSDVELHVMDGMALCRLIRADATLTNLPVILISGSRMDVKDQIEGMERGADDYLLKPVLPRLLAARIRSVLRRYAAPQALHATLRAAALELDGAARTVTVAGRSVALTRKEFDLLTLLLERRGEAVRHQVLLDVVWGIDPAKDVDTETLKTHVSSLRHKLGRAVGDRICSVRGVGYRFEA